MIKKIGLSAAAILAVVTLAKPPAMMAADRDDYRRDFRECRDRDHHERIDYRRFDRRDDHDRDWR